MNDAKNVTAGKPKVGGSVNVAPVGTNLPTSASTELALEFANLGYCSDDGLTNGNSPESSKVKAWGGDTVLSIQNGKPDTFKLKLIEVMNVNVLKTVYGEDNVSGSISSGLTIIANSKEAVPHSWVIDLVLKGDVLKRIVVPDATITEIAEIKYTDSDAVGYEITLTAVPDAAGNTHYEYLIGDTGTAAYTVTVSAGEGGSAFANASTASSGATVSLAASPASGYTFSGWSCEDESVAFADASSAITTFTMPSSSVTIVATFTEG